MSALQNAVLPDDRVGVYWVVVDNASPALHAALSWSFPPLRGVPLDTCHLPLKYEAWLSITVQRAPGCSVSKVNVSFPSEVSDVDAPEPFRGERKRQFTSDEVFFYDHLCRASLSREHMDAAVTSMKSAEVWSGLVAWIWALAAVATLYPEEMNNKHSKKGKTRLRLSTAAATFQKYQWYLNNARLRSTVACQQVALLGTGTCGSEALHAELGGVFRQAYNVSVPTCRLKLDLFKLSK